MSELKIWTYDWVPDGPRGYVRDLRLRWACEEAKIPYATCPVKFDDRETNHLARQPFGQVPFLDDGDVQIFESGACVLRIAAKSESLMPSDENEKAETIQWVIAALNSIEMVTVPWWFLKQCGVEDNPLTGWMGQRLEQLEKVFRDRAWLVGDRFTAADLMMTDVLRIPDVRAFGERPATEDYVSRVTNRPAFRKALADQIAHFGSNDRNRFDEAI